MKQGLISILENKNFNIIRDLILLITFVITIAALFSFPVSYIIVIILLLISFSLVLISGSMFVLFNKTKIPISSRFDFTKKDLRAHINNSSSSIKILCIFLTWSEELIPWIFEKMKNDQKIQIELLLVKRKRIPSDISYIRMREEDELKRRMYVPEINKTLWSLFTELLDMSWKKTGVIKNLEVREYEFMPFLCMYIFDDRRLIFGPYIAKTCDHIPMMEISKHQGFELLSSDNYLAYSELMKHYDILSGRDFRGNKDYPSGLCFFDGWNNISIHLMIENNARQLVTYLTPHKRLKYLNYLIGDEENKFEDSTLRALGEDKNEGRFDAVLRYISDRHIDVSQQKPPDPSNWLDELLTIVGMAKRSADYIIAHPDEGYSHSKRLKDLNIRLQLLDNQLTPQTISPNWLRLLRDLHRALESFDKSQRGITWITELQEKITEKYRKREEY